MATMNVSLPDPMRDWVEEQIKGGQYSNNSDYVRDLIRRDQNRKNNIKSLQQAITEGIESGQPEDFDMKQFKNRMLENTKIDKL